MPDTREPAGPRAELDRLGLRADCDRCFALCCVAPAFSASADFAISKPAGQPCPNLGSDFRCGVHARLRQQGFRGCAAYDCLGAGQKVSQVTFGGQDWRGTGENTQGNAGRNARHSAGRGASRMFEVFAIMRGLHELLWYLGHALALRSVGPLRAELSTALRETERLTLGEPDSLLSLDLPAHRQAVNGLLRQASQLARANHPGADLAGGDLIGADLAGADLTGASLRGAYLIGANLVGADLTLADLTGTDLRDADLRGANLRGTIFLMQSQIDAARGDASTALPPGLSRPAHWPGPRDRP